MRHKRQTKFQAGGGVNLALMITPMLDMAFQLLAFFIMTYHTPLMEGYIEGSLLPPRVEKAKDKDKANIDPTQPGTAVADEDPPLNDTLLVVIRTLAEKDEANERPLLNGEPRWVEIKLPESAQPIIKSGDRSVFKNWTKDPRDKLTGVEITERNQMVAEYTRSLVKEVDRELKQILKKPGAKSTDVRLEADSRLKHRYWMAIYDTCKLAGFENIHFVAPAQSE